MIDPDRRPTPFQWRVLNLVRAKGPIAIAGLQPHFQQHGNEAIRSACWILRRGGYLTYAAGQVDVTAAGRLVLQLHEKQTTKRGRWNRIAGFFRRRLDFTPLGR